MQVLMLVPSLTCLLLLLGDLDYSEVETLDHGEFRHLSLDAANELFCIDLLGHSFVVVLHKALELIRLFIRLVLAN
jgi:hypothetical protein